MQFPSQTLFFLINSVKEKFSLENYDERFSRNSSTTFDVEEGWILNIKSWSEEPERRSNLAQDEQGSCRLACSSLLAVENRAVVDID